MVLAQQDRHRLQADRLMFQPGPYSGRQRRDPAEGDIEPPGRDLGRRTRQPAVEAGDQLTAVRHPLPGRLQRPVGGTDRDPHIDQQRPLGGGPERGGQLVVCGQHPPRERQ